MEVNTPRDVQLKETPRAGGDLQVPIIGDAKRALKAEDASFSEERCVDGRQLSILGVLDGHGGKEAVTHCCEHLPARLEEAARDGLPLDQACSHAFDALNKEIRQLGITSGTTATVLVLDRTARRLLCCNVGDSNALLLTAKEQKRMTTDHRLSVNVDEQERVRSAGGKVAYARHPTGNYPTGPLRMWPGGLAMGRAIGDTDCEDFVLSEPALSWHEVPAHGACAVVCSDGVWDSLSEDVVVRIVRTSLAAPSGASKRRGSKQRAAPASPAQSAAEAVVAAAVQARGLLDDVTCMVMVTGFEPSAAAAAPSASASGPSTSADAGAEGATNKRARGFWARLRRALPRAGGMAQEPGSEYAGMEYTVKGGHQFSKTFRGLRLRKGGSFQSSPSPGRYSRVDIDASCQPQPPGEAAEGQEGAVGSVHANSLQMPIGVRALIYADLGDRGISDMTYLGSGEFCSVFRTVLDGHDCAVKMLRNNKINSPNARRDLDFEMHLMVRLKHRNILCALGVSKEHDVSKQFLVLEPLTTVLAKALPPPAANVSMFERRAAIRRWPMLRGLRYGLELAMALQYCHDEAFEAYRVLHRDIKPKNIGLVNSGGTDRLVLFDFGISKLVRRDQQGWQDGVQMTGMCGSLRYMAPEVATCKRYNHKSEAYSFGLLLWEMIAHERPYEGMPTEEFENRVCKAGVRPRLERTWHPLLKDLLTSTFEPDFRARPEFELLVEDLQTLVASISFNPASAYSGS